jgi:hypothetical protein
MVLPRLAACVNMFRWGGRSMNHGSKTVLYMAAAAVSRAAIAQIDVQAPGVHVEASAGIAARSEYRDFILQTGSSAFVAGSVAARGFSASVWSASGAAEWREALVGYSHKLPIVDVHLAYVSSKAPYGLGGDFARIALTSNNSESTVVSITTDLQHGGAALTNVRATHAFATNAPFQLAISASATRARLGADTKVGRSVRFHLAHSFGDGARLNAHAGYVSGQANPAAPSHGAVYGVSITHTF